jgi:hypothetical protein
VAKAGTVCVPDAGFRIIIISSGLFWFAYSAGMSPNTEAQIRDMEFIDRIAMAGRCASKCGGPVTVEVGAAQDGSIIRRAVCIARLCISCAPRSIAFAAERTPEAAPLSSGLPALRFSESMSA